MFVEGSVITLILLNELVNRLVVKLNDTLFLQPSSHLLRAPVTTDNSIRYSSFNIFGQFNRLGPFLDVAAELYGEPVGACNLFVPCYV